MLKNKPCKIVVKLRVWDQAKPALDGAANAAGEVVFSNYRSLMQVDLYVGGPAPCRRAVESLKMELAKGKASTIDSVSVVQADKREMRIVRRIVERSRE